MIIPVIHANWQVLRVLVRNKNNPTLGSDLRYQQTRRTADGQFLKDLVEKGLLKIKLSSKDPFKSKYVLTKEGRHAAEYGEYDADFKTGIAVPLQETASA